MVTLDTDIKTEIQQIRLLWIEKINVLDGSPAQEIQDLIKRLKNILEFEPSLEGFMVFNTQLQLILPKEVHGHFPFRRTIDLSKKLSCFI